jgi:hypothetical protein
VVESKRPGVEQRSIGALARAAGKDPLDVMLDLALAEDLATVFLQSSTVIFMIESLSFCHFHILVGNFIIELGLYIPMMGFLKCPRSS